MGPDTTTGLRPLNPRTRDDRGPETPPASTNGAARPPTHPGAPRWKDSHGLPATLSTGTRFPRVTVGGTRPRRQRVGHNGRLNEYRQTFDEDKPVSGHKDPTTGVSTVNPKLKV